MFGGGRVASEEYWVKMIVLVAIALLGIAVITGALRAIAGNIGSLAALLVILVLLYYFFLRKL